MRLGRYDRKEETPSTMRQLKLGRFTFDTERLIKTDYNASNKTIMSLSLSDNDMQLT